MLTQSYRREVPERDGAIERTIFRSPRFCIAVVRSRRIAMDPGLLGAAQSHPARFRRPQLTIVLAGRGYLDLGGRHVELRAGDVACTDQRTHRGEGYGWASAEVVVVDWDGDAIFGRDRLDAATHARLRALVRRLGSPSPDQWVVELARELRPWMGATALPGAPGEIAAASAPLATLYAALGPALSRLDLHPSLADVAEAVGTSERHANRLLATLAEDYDHPFTGWRELVHGMRLGWATQILSLPGVPLDRVAQLAGYRSTIAMHHAFSLRGAPTPRVIERELGRRWR